MGVSDLPLVVAHGTHLATAYLQIRLLVYPPSLIKTRLQAQKVCVTPRPL